MIKNFLLLPFLFVFHVAHKPTENPLPKTVYETYRALGGKPYAHAPADTSARLIKAGFEIVTKGRTHGPNGKLTPYVSKYYNCTSCHNQVRESAVLTDLNPESRLQYAKANDLPYLQASTFYGIVNRESWYNNDYQEKYGQEAVAAHHDLRKAIQLCSSQCSQGRFMTDWELDAVTAYLWTLQLKVSDLQLSEVEKEQLQEALNNPSENKNTEALTLLKSKYLQASPAHFVNTPYSKKEGYKDITGRPEMGKVIFEQGCKHCHWEHGVSERAFPADKLTFRNLLKHMEDNNSKSFYQTIRYGTSPYEGHKPYMPQFSKEKMSNQQVEDLRAYFEQQASS